MQFSLGGTLVEFIIIDSQGDSNSLMHHCMNKNLTIFRSGRYLDWFEGRWWKANKDACKFLVYL